MFSAHFRRTPLAVMATGALAVAVGGCEVNLETEGVTATEARTFDVSGTPEVVLQTFDGSIEVHSWDRDAIEVEVEKRAMNQELLDQIKIAVEQDGNRVVVNVTGPGGEGFRGITVGNRISPTARLRVALPRKTNLQASSGDGAISIDDVTGTVKLDTEDGSVRASRVYGDIHVRSGDGTINMEKVEGRLDLETMDGSITLDAKPTFLRGRTADGAIRVQVAPESAMAEDWELTTGDGSIMLTLPTSFNAELDAESGDGSVQSSHPGIRTEERTGSDRQERRRTLRATMGTGGKILRLRTSDGRVRIES
jgi:hypothetical protein